MLTLPDAAHLVNTTVILGIAALLGGLLGVERESEGKAAGLRTHMLVALGAALFMRAGLDAGMPVADIGRVVQGVAAGVGFIGAGTILKITGARQIHGLTTAASLWLAAALGAAVGSGAVVSAVVATVIALMVLAVLGAVQRRVSPGRDDSVAGDGGASS